MLALGVELDVPTCSVAGVSYSAEDGIHSLEFDQVRDRFRGFYQFQNFVEASMRCQEFEAKDDVEDFICPSSVPGNAADRREEVCLRHGLIAEYFEILLDAGLLFLSASNRTSGRFHDPLQKSTSRWYYGFGHDCEEGLQRDLGISYEVWKSLNKFVRNSSTMPVCICKEKLKSRRKDYLKNLLNFLIVPFKDGDKSRGGISLSERPEEITRCETVIEISEEQIRTFHHISRFFRLQKELDHLKVFVEERLNESIGLTVIASDSHWIFLDRFIDGVARRAHLHNWILVPSDVVGILGERHPRQLILQVRSGKSTDLTRIDLKGDLFHRADHDEFVSPDECLGELHKICAFYSDSVVSRTIRVKNKEKFRFSLRPSDSRDEKFMVSSVSLSAASIGRLIRRPEDLSRSVRIDRFPFAIHIAHGTHVQRKLISENVAIPHESCEDLRLMAGEKFRILLKTSNDFALLYAFTFRGERDADARISIVIDEAGTLKMSSDCDDIRMGEGYLFKDLVFAFRSRRCFRIAKSCKN